MTPSRYQKIRKTLDKRQPDLTVLTENVHKPHNISAIMRTCDAVGITTAHIVMPEDDDFRARSGIAMGSERWVDYQIYDDIDGAVSELKKQNYAIYAAHLSKSSIDYRSIDYTQPTAILMGTEKYGVSERAIELSDVHIAIPMLGMVESFNVSVATAIILAEAQRQRVEVGLYNENRLPPELYEQYLFRWCQPVVTNFCDERGLDYPPLDDEGEVLNAPEWMERVRNR